jgi:hypothetical protein
MCVRACVCVCASHLFNAQLFLLSQLFNSMKKASALGPASSTSTSSGNEFVGFVEALSLHIRDWTQRRRAPRVRCLEDFVLFFVAHLLAVLI